jgi:hypothetical protein
LEQRQIPEGITPCRLARATPPEHAGVGVLGLKLGYQQRHEVAFRGAVLFEGLPNPITEQRGSGIGEIGENVLLDGRVPVSEALPYPVVDGGRGGLHEAIVA